MVGAGDDEAGRRELGRKPAHRLDAAARTMGQNHQRIPALAQGGVLRCGRSLEDAIVADKHRLTAGFGGIPDGDGELAFPLRCGNVDLADADVIGLRRGGQAQKEGSGGNELEEGHWASRCVGKDGRPSPTPRLSASSIAIEVVPNRDLGNDPLIEMPACRSPACRLSVRLCLSAFV